MSPENQWLEDVFSIEIGHSLKLSIFVERIMYIEKKFGVCGGYYFLGQLKLSLGNLQLEFHWFFTTLRVIEMEPLIGSYIEAIQFPFVVEGPSVEDSDSLDLFAQCFADQRCSVWMIFWAVV